MRRPMIFICIAMLAIIIVSLFQVKHNVQNLKKDLAEINRETAANESSIHVLNAEWAYLNEPARIKRLSDKYLNMGYTNVAQLKHNDDIKTIYMASKEPAGDSAGHTTPTLKPILSSVRGYR